MARPTAVREQIASRTQHRGRPWKDPHYAALLVEQSMTAILIGDSRDTRGIDMEQPLIISAMNGLSGRGLRQRLQQSTPTILPSQRYHHHRQPLPRVHQLLGCSPS